LTVKQQIGIGQLPDLDVNAMKEMKECVKNDPEKAKAKFHITSSIYNNFKVTNKITRFEVGQQSFQHSFNIVSDQPKPLGGNDSGATPEELLLSALGSCLCMSFLCLAKEENLNLTRCDVKTRAKIDLRSVFEEKGQVQRGFRAVIAKFDVQGENLNPDRLHNLIHRAELLSPIAQTVKKSNQVHVCLKGEGKDIEQRFGLIGKEEVGQEGISQQRPRHGRQLEPGRQRKTGSAPEAEHVEGYQELEGVKFLQPGVSVSPRRDESQQGQLPQQRDIKSQVESHEKRDIKPEEESHEKESKVKQRGKTDIPKESKAKPGEIASDVKPVSGSAKADITGIGQKKDQGPKLEEQKPKDLPTQQTKGPQELGHEGKHAVESLGKQEKTTGKDVPSQPHTLAQEQKPQEKRTGTEGVLPESNTR